MRRGDMAAAARSRGVLDRSSRAADERLLEAMRRRDAGEDVRHVAARLGYTGGAALDEDLARSEGRPMRKRAPTVLPPGRRTCAVPGCGRVLYAGNRSGVCRAHNHDPRYCRCAKCAR